jgi:hypothetical protein
MKAINTYQWDESNSFEDNIKGMADFYNNKTEYGQGFFFDFSKTPEVKKPILDYLIKNLGWKYDYNKTFIRKPEAK